MVASRNCGARPAHSPSYGPPPAPWMPRGAGPRPRPRTSRRRPAGQQQRAALYRVCLWPRGGDRGCLGAAQAGGELERDCWGAGPGPPAYPLAAGRKTATILRQHAGCGRWQARTSLWGLHSGAQASSPPGLGGPPPPALARVPPGTSLPASLPDRALNGEGADMRMCETKAKVHCAAGQPGGRRPPVARSRRPGGATPRLAAVGAQRNLAATSADLSAGPPTCRQRVARERAAAQAGVGRAQQRARSGLTSASLHVTTLPPPPHCSAAAVLRRSPRQGQPLQELPGCRSQGTTMGGGGTGRSGCRQRWAPRLVGALAPAAGICRLHPAAAVEATHSM